MWCCQHRVGAVSTYPLNRWNGQPVLIGKVNSIISAMLYGEQSGIDQGANRALYRIPRHPAFLRQRFHARDAHPGVVIGAVCQHQQHHLLLHRQQLIRGPRHRLEAH